MKPTVAIFGHLPPCSFIDGFPWHIGGSKDGESLLSKVARGANLIQMDKIDSQNNDFKNLANSDLSGFYISFKNQPYIPEKLCLFEQLRVRFPNAIPLNDPRRYREFDSKLSFKEFFSGSDFDDLVPDVTLVTDPSFSRNLYPILIKPDNLSTGRGLFLARNNESVRKALVNSAPR
jgi:hypothetical protein